MLYFPACTCAFFFLVRIYPSALFSVCAFFRVCFFPSAFFSHALIYICAFFRCAFFLCAFFPVRFFPVTENPYCVIMYQINYLKLSIDTSGKVKRNGTCNPIFPQRIPMTEKTMNNKLHILFTILRLFAF